MFYFIVYRNNGYDIPHSKCIDEHPLKWYNNNIRKKTLLNWKEISEDEFNMCRKK